MRPALLLLMPLAAAAVYFALSRREELLGAVADDASDEPADSGGGAVDGGGFFQTIEEGTTFVTAAIRKVFTLPARAASYSETIARAEDRNGIPPSLLGRLLHQESAFRPDVISGATRSSAGAVGIAQFMPATARSMGVDPLNPIQSIDGAAAYLRRLYDRFGNWADALAAYNWGEGNVNAYLRTGVGAKGQQRPAENINYVSQILKDVSV